MQKIWRLVVLISLLAVPACERDTVMPAGLEEPVVFEPVEATAQLAARAGLIITITKLPLLPGDAECGTYDLDPTGRVVGYCDDHPVRWTDGVPEALAMPPEADGCYAVAIAPSGDILGGCWTTIDQGERHWAVLWHHDEVRSVDPTDGGQAVPLDMAPSGTAVGWMRPQGVFGEVPVRWTADSFEFLPLPENVTQGGARAIAPSGDIGGYVYTDLRQAAAFWPSDGGVRLLPPVPGHEKSLVHDLTGLENAVGLGIGHASGLQAVRWTESSVVLLPPLSAGGQSLANTTTASGIAAGWAEAADGNPHAVLWFPGESSPLDLAAATGVGHSSASAITANGRTVAGWFRTATGERRGAVWTLAPARGKD